jgi:hypothetical protein
MPQRGDENMTESRYEVSYVDGQVGLTFWCSNGMGGRIEFSSSTWDEIVQWYCAQDDFWSSGVEDRVNGFGWPDGDHREAWLHLNVGGVNTPDGSKHAVSIERYDMQGNSAADITMQRSDFTSLVAQWKERKCGTVAA